MTFDLTLLLMVDVQIHGTVRTSCGMDNGAGFFGEKQWSSQYDNGGASITIQQLQQV